MFQKREIHKLVLHYGLRDQLHEEGRRALYKYVCAGDPVFLEKLLDIDKLVSNSADIFLAKKMSFGQRVEIKS